MKKKFGLISALIMILMVGLSACQPTVVEKIVEVAKEVPVIQPAIEKTVVEFWTTDNEEARVNVYDAIAKLYMEEHPDVDVRIVPIDEATISQRIATARAANRLPDIVRMGVERVSAFSADGIMDEDAATATIEAIGKNDFRGGLLSMVTDSATGKYSAIPYDGWLQAIWYRQDIFTELNLKAPTTWDDINAACDKLAGTGNLLYSMVLPNDPGQNYPHQVFEQVAISNNAWPFDENGKVTMNTPEMIEALTFYSDLIRCSAPGPQYWRGAREMYELDQSGMMFYSTYIMDDLVDGSGMASGDKVVIAVENLAEKTGFAPSLKGPNGAAVYGQLVALGIMKDADPVAQDVVKFFMTGKNYQDVLALAPLGKVPVLTSAVAGWKDLSPYFANYSRDTLEQIANGYDSMQRWLFRPGYNATEQAVVGDIEGRLLIPQVLSNIILEKSMTPETGAQFLQEQVEKLLADRTK